MNVAEMRFGWQQQGPLLSGYGYQFAREAELIRPGQKKVVQYASRDHAQHVTPSLLATAVKGVLRNAAAWLVEREAQVQQGNSAKRRYVTYDYGSARPAEGGWRKAVGVVEHADQLDPVGRIFGGSGNLSNESSNVLRRQSLVQVLFIQNGLNSDALFGEKVDGGKHFFAWEVASGMTDKSKALELEQLRVAPGAQLAVKVQVANDAADYRLAVALIGLSADLISTGFFRFGRFTSRGYGWVRLVEPQGRTVALAALLDGGTPAWQMSTSGSALAQSLLGTEPMAVIREAVREWLGSAAVVEERSMDKQAATRPVIPITPEKGGVNEAFAADVLARLRREGEAAKQPETKLEVATQGPTVAKPGSAQEVTPGLYVVGTVRRVEKERVVVDLGIPGVDEASLVLDRIVPPVSSFEALEERFPSGDLLHVWVHSINQRGRVQLTMKEPMKR
jgi:CRISPR/Cas system CSM-associated protein Csm3 (group 7 of RAMP superfamily)